MKQLPSGDFRPIDIRNSKYFNKNAEYKTLGVSLSDIDAFTTRFDDEDKLRKALLREGLLSIKDYNIPLSIRYFKNNKVEKVHNKFLFSSDLEYLQDPNLLIMDINDEFLAGRFSFIRKLAENLQFTGRDAICPELVDQVRINAVRCILENDKLGFTEAEMKRFSNALTMMLTRIIYRDPETINYVNLHHVIAFINAFENKQKERLAKRRIKKQ